MTPHNKFGVHVIVDGSHDWYGDELERCTAAGQPFGLAKCMFDKGAGGQAKAVSRATYTIYRCSIDDRDFPHTADGSWTWANSAECKASALDWVHKCAALWDGERENFDAYELVNEPNPVTVKIPQFLEWSYYCLDEAERLGYRIAWGSFSTGCPTAEQMQYAQRFNIKAQVTFKAQMQMFAQQMGIMLPFVADLARRGHILAMHDGAVVEPFTFQGTATTDTVINSSLRYRWWKRLADNANLPFPRVAITECYAYGSKNPAFYEDWKWYLTELARDDYLIGVAWYTLGNGGDFGNIAGKPMQTAATKSLEIDYGAIDTEPPPIVIMPPIILKVPYLPQTSITADLSYNDCAPACEAMIARYLGDIHTVNEWYAASGAGSGLISITEMQTAATGMGYTLTVLRDQNLATLRAMIDSGKPCILLINPVSLQKCGTTSPHFIVVIGYSKVSNSFYCHDPYFLGPGAGGPMIEQTTLAEAWSRCHEQYDNPDWLMMTMSKGVVPPPIIGMAWRGLQLNNGDKNTTADWQCVIEAELNAVKLTTDTDIADLDFACTLVPPSHILLRLFADLSDRVVGPVEFASWFGLWLAKFASVGGKYVEVHNEPNLYTEGLGKSWIDGTSFALWLLVVLNELRKWQPSLKYGFPGLSPGGSIAKVRMDEMTFFGGALPALAHCDWLGVHCYWLDDAGMELLADGRHYAVFHDEGKLEIVTEFSNSGEQLKAKKGQQYRKYYASLPDYVIGAYSFISSSDNPAFASETWAGTEIPGIVGSGLV